MHETNRQIEGYTGIYLERSGKSARALTETLVASPEMPLDDEQKAEVYQFENALFEHQIREGVSVADAIRNHKAEATIAPLFFASPFISGEIDLSEMQDVPQFQTSTDVYRWVAENIRQGTISPTDLRKIAKSSTESYINAMTNSLVEQRELDTEQYAYMPIVVDPEAFVRTEQDLAAVRARLLDLRKVHKADSMLPIEGAKRAVTDVYLGKVNSLLADDVPVADYLMQQSELIGDTELQAVAATVMPNGLRTALHTPEMKARVLKRLDYLRNGMGIDTMGQATTVAAEAHAITTEKSAEYRFSGAEVKLLKKFLVQPDTMIDIFTNILAKAEKLSSEPAETWTPMRPNRAADDLYQVVKNPGLRTFAVSGPSGAFKVASKPRSLYDVMVVGGVHELEHIDQSEADRRLGEVLKISELKGKRVSMIREVGANTKQRQAERKLFGESKPISMTYARALQAIESGSDIQGATKAFYDEKLQSSAGTSPESAAAEAADRVLRLIRKGGMSSQAMVYAEESILLDEMEGASNEAKVRATAVSSLDLVDQVRLHKYGLLPPVEAQSIDWTRFVMDELEPYVNQALAVSTKDEVQ